MGINRVLTLLICLLVAVQGSIRFQNGQDNYDGCVDTTLHSEMPGASISHGHEEYLTLEDDTNDRFALIRFNTILEPEGPLPKAVNITSAVLTFWKDGDSLSTSGLMYNVLTSWDQNSTFSNFPAQAGVGYARTSSASLRTTDLTQGFVEVDVKKSIEDWISGDTNLGWYILSSTTGTTRIASSNHFNVSRRPSLSIEYVSNLPPNPTRDPTDGVPTSAILRECTSPPPMPSFTCSDGVWILRTTKLEVTGTMVFNSDTAIQGDLIVPRGAELHLKDASVTISNCAVLNGTLRVTLSSLSQTVIKLFAFNSRCSTVAFAETILEENDGDKDIVGRSFLVTSSAFEVSLQTEEVDESTNVALVAIIVSVAVVVFILFVAGLAVILLYPRYRTRVFTTPRGAVNSIRLTIQP